MSGHHAAIPFEYPVLGRPFHAGGVVHDLWIDVSAADLPKFDIITKITNPKNKKETIFRNRGVLGRNNMGDFPVLTGDRMLVTFLPLDPNSVGGHEKFYDVWVSAYFVEG